MTQSRKILRAFKRNLSKKRAMTEKQIKTFFIETKARIHGAID